MKNNITYNKSLSPDATLKVTSLLYFKDALKRERYEDCADLIKSAKQFGASQKEIRQLITDHVNGVKANQDNETEEDEIIRRRF